MFFVFLMSSDSFQPLFMIPFIKNDLKAIMPSNYEKILISLHEFLIREYIAVGEKKDRLIPLLKKSLHGACRAWTATNMKQYPLSHKQSGC